MTLMCKKTHVLEKIGTFFILCGAVLMIFDPQAIHKGEKIDIIVSIIALTISIPGALFWVANEYLLENIDLLSVLLSQMFLTTIYLIILSASIENITYDLSDTGLFGFLSQKNFNLCFWTGAFSSFWGFCGYIIAM
jgi:hypothetical protein